MAKMKETLHKLKELLNKLVWLKNTQKMVIINGTHSIPSSAPKNAIPTGTGFRK